MQLIATLIAVASVLSSTSASVAADKGFHLKTVLKPGQTNTAFDGLYVDLFHVGAGFCITDWGANSNAATLQKTKAHLATQTINATSTEVMFLIPGEKKFPARLFFLYPEDDDESGWGSTQINSVTAGTKGFSLNSNGFLVNKKPEIGFGGWRVCDWVHGVPELFHNLKGFYDGVPSSCALVDLKAEAI